MIAFRQKALVKQRSPEQLDEPLRVMLPMGRLARWVFILSGFLLLLWGLFGSYPETGNGRGIFIVPNAVVPIQSQADGQIGAWFVSVGEFVSSGKVLGRLENWAVQQELDQAQAKYEETAIRLKALAQIREDRHELAMSTLDRKSQLYKSRIKYLSEFTENARRYALSTNANTLDSLKIQREDLTAARERSSSVTQSTQDRLESYARLRQERLASIDSVNNAKRQHEDSKLKLQDMDLQLLELDLREVEARETLLETQNLLEQKENMLTTLNLQLRILENDEVQLTKLKQEADFRDKGELDELQRIIERLKKRLDTENVIASEFAGRVLELTSSEGAVVTFGQRLVQIETETRSDDLIVLAYCQDKLGKHLVPGSTVRVSPTTVDQRRFGSIVGKVIKVTDYPVTTEAVVNYVGNSEVARTLTSGNHHIELTIGLTRDASSPSGYGWTSLHGPDVEITQGTTADIQVTYGRRSPLSFVLPKIREWTGIEVNAGLGD
jgi:HlyD family secretion protein